MSLWDWIAERLSGRIDAVTLGTIVEPSARPGNFERALKFTLSWEGGRANVVGDLGGRTNRGITQRTYDEWNYSRGVPRGDVYDITDAEVSNIYRSRYWEDRGCAALAWPLSLIHFDSCVQFRPQTTDKFLASTRDPKAYIDLRRAYHKFRSTFPGQSKFLTGWLNRCDALEEEACC